MSKKYVIGIDFGGTKILTAVADMKGSIISRVRIATQPEQGRSKVMGRLIRSAVEAMKKADVRLSDVAKICIAAPGPVMFDKGVIVSPPNLPGWKKVPLRSILQKVFRKPVLVDNDANLAALAEARKGAGKGKKNIVYMTVSTGIGGGIILGGRLFRGTSGGAGEVGHMVIKKDGPVCGCGSRGCLEIMGSGTAMGRMARELAGKGSLMMRLAGGKRMQISAMTVEMAAKKGDKTAIKIINEIGGNIGIGVANIVNILSPDMVIIGGGLSNMGQMLFKPVMKAYKNNVLSVPAKGVKVVKAKLGSNTGVVGAVLGALEG